jgi:hypothetical protein
MYELYSLWQPQQQVDMPMVPHRLAAWVHASIYQEKKHNVAFGF